MAGGLFAIDRKYFHRLGAYDEGMESWGSENLEMSFRVRKRVWGEFFLIALFKVWMCGGTLEIIPCSRVGHIFRRSRPYDEPSDAMKMLRNQLRLVHVWLDDYKKYYYQVRAPTSNSVGHTYFDDVFLGFSQLSRHRIWGCEWTEGVEGTTWLQVFRMVHQNRIPVCKAASG